MLSNEVKGQLVSWKFSQAVTRLEFPSDTSEPTYEELELIKALATLCGNVGWGAGGILDPIISACVGALVRGEVKEPD